MVPLVFRKAIFSDLEAIITLLIDDDLGKEREKTAVDSVYKVALDQILADPNQFLMVVEKEGRAIGTCH